MDGMEEEVNKEVDGLNTSRKIPVTPFLRKLEFVDRNGSKRNFLDRFEHARGSEVLFEEGGCLERAREIYDEFGLDDYIEKVFITAQGSFWEAGTSDPQISNHNLRITITIASYKLGIVNDGQTINRLDSKFFKIFEDVFYHELFHAKSSVELVRAYGIDELERIKEEKSIATMAWTVLDEYIANKETAQAINFYNTHETVRKAFDCYNNGFTRESGTGDFSEIKLISLHQKLNYAIATRCALADVFGNEEYHLSLSSLAENQIEYVNGIRKLLREYESVRPINYAGYLELGERLMKLPGLSNPAWNNN